MHAITYQGRTGCQRAHPPHDLPQKNAAYYCAAWRDDGTDQVVHELLRRRVREHARPSEDPTLVVLDTHSAQHHQGPHGHDRPRSGQAGAGPQARRPGTPNAIAFAHSTRVFHRLRSSSSICIEDQNDSIIALSRPSPTVPNDGRSPAERTLSPKTQEVNWAP